MQIQLPLSALFAWSSVILFSLLPKRLSVLDFAFLYCVILILTTATFTVFDVNLHYVTIQRTPMIAFSTIIVRIVTIPVLIMIAVDALQRSEGKKPRWFFATCLWIGLAAFDWILDFFNIITYHHSFVMHLGSTLVMYFGFISVSWYLVWWYRNFNESGLSRDDSSDRV
ncbi:hypothetical protein AAC03nite_16840 [Alicyclobacillus acidoterrestris]|uniref:hypothetical protein n=1 Tax=Alicyclobacillus suci TaxID=2816080 RepID=UPI001193D794|nr:hypothetical protein [Alicyclobacillus suci]GEO25899.1 hypothetical protein AAC03nite_16840 [Alicyclobacillus acidoterrestris]